MTRIITIKVPASPLPLEVLAVELHRSVEIATKSGPHKSASSTNFQSRKFQIEGQGTTLSSPPSSWSSLSSLSSSIHDGHGLHLRSCKEESTVNPTVRPTKQEQSSTRMPITSSGEQQPGGGGKRPLSQQVFTSLLVHISTYIILELASSSAGRWPISCTYPPKFIMM